MKYNEIFNTTVIYLIIMLSVIFCKVNFPLSVNLFILEGHRNVYATNCSKIFGHHRYGYSHNTIYICHCVYLAENCNVSTPKLVSEL